MDTLFDIVMQRLSQKRSIKLSTERGTFKKVNETSRPSNKELFGKAPCRHT